MHTVHDVEGLDARAQHWVPSVVSPCRHWPGAPGAHRGSRYLIGAETLRPGRSDYAAFDTEFECRRWIKAHAGELARNAPGAQVTAVPLDRWLLGLS